MAQTQQAEAELAYQKLQGAHMEAAASLARVERELELKEIERDSLQRLLDSMVREAAADSSDFGGKRVALGRQLRSKNLHFLLLRDGRPRHLRPPLRIP